MKQLIALSLILLHFHLCSQEWLEDKEDLKGDVKSVRYTSGYFFEYSEFNRSDDNYYEYTSKGFLSRSILSSSESGPAYNGIRRIFNEDGDRCLEDYFIFNGDETTASKTVFEYDESGKVKESVHYTDPEEHWNTSYHIYNEAGQLCERLIVIRHDGDTLRDIYEYDASGRMIKHSDVSSSCVLIITWNYDAHGNLTEERSILEKAPRTISYTVNADGTIGEPQILENDPDDERNHVTSYTYNDRRQVIRKVQKFPDGRLQYDITYKYNRNGDADTEYYRDRESGKRSKSSFVYKYDTHGNWTRKDSYRNHKLYRTEEREITYYK
jgi:hypothetical protein